MAFIEPVTLQGALATLVPLDPEHETALAKAAADGELWRLWYTHIAPPDKMREYVAIALDMRTRLGAMPFVVRESGRVAPKARQARAGQLRAASRSNNL